MTDAHAPSISAVFPCHNEAENVEWVIRDALEHLPAITDAFEVLIVDDGSTDGTAARADAAARGDPRVRVVAHPTNLGYGRALRSGFEAAKHELIFYADGDGQFSLADLPRLVQALDGRGFVVGYRRQRADPPHRRLNAWLWNMSVRLLLGTRVRDLDCGFKLFRREAVFVTDLISGRGAAISAELVTRAARAGHAYAQVGVTHYPRRAGEQSGNDLRVVLRSFVDLLRLRLALR